MGELFEKHFVAAHQQVGAFTATNVNGNVVKQGGNVASYFCTPGGRVIHAVIGPVGADELLKEANWALAAWAQASKQKNLEMQQRLMAQSHSAAQPSGGIGPKNVPFNMPRGAWSVVTKLVGTQQQKVHQLFAERPLAPLEEVYVDVFERILGERVSSAPNVELAEQGLQLADKENRPMLFILHNLEDNALFAEYWLAWLKTNERANPHLLPLLRQCVVIALPQKELPALSQRLKQEPYSANTLGSPLLVVTDPQGKQLASFTGYQAVNQLNQPLAKALVAEIKLSPPANVSRLKEFAALVRRIDPALAAELQPVIEEITANNVKKARVAKN